MNCCHRDIADAQFGDKMARGDLERFRRKGPDPTTRGLLSHLRDLPAPGSTLLDIGSGIGVLAQELMQAGSVQRATLVDESSAYMAAARNLARERDTVERCSFVHGDFVEVQPSLPKCDVVTLDRVVCCYPDFQALLSAAASSSDRVCGLSYPRDRAYIRAVVAVSNFVRRLKRSDFRVYVHREADMTALLGDHGFRIRSETGTFVWKVVVLAREPIAD